MKQHDLFDFFKNANNEISKEYERICRRTIEDPGTAGDQGEANWKRLLEMWLPPYFHVVNKGRIIGDTGETSPQIDLLVLSPEYPKQDECSMDAEIDDLDINLLEQYRNNINAQNDSFEQILAARGFLKKQQGKFRLTNAAVLLFAKNIQQFYPNCRVRFIRYDGTSAGVGTRLNVTKDVNVEQPLLRIIDKAQEFIDTQLREFTALDGETGKFKTVPEYPEFAWKEGIVNAVTHREYSMSGNYIKVSMYDDRLEIESPGRLPNIVTVENIKETRFARNPRISRVLTEFGWVRELNEGVKRIYSDMAKFFLDAPIYSEPEQGVKLVLKNNIVARRLRQTSRAAENVGVEQWKGLDDLEHLILTLMSSRGAVKRSDIEQYTGKSGKTVNTRLNHLLELNIIIANGNRYDPRRTYELKSGSKTLTS